MSKSKVTQVSFGLRKFDGLLVDANVDPILFGIGVPQIGDLFPKTFQRKNGGFKTHNNYSAQTLKRIMGKGFKTHKHATELSGRNKTNVVYLPDFEKVLLKLAFRGDTDAQEWLEELAGLSLHQLFCDAFGVRFEKEERQNLLIKRQVNKDSFWFITDHIKAYCDRHEIEPVTDKFNYYQQAMIAINQAVIGRNACEVRDALQVHSQAELIRDYYNREIIDIITVLQKSAGKRIDRKDMEPLQAIASVTGSVDPAECIEEILNEQGLLRLEQIRGSAA